RSRVGLFDAVALLELKSLSADVRRCVGALSNQHSMKNAERKSKKSCELVAPSALKSA
ncbi:MAG: hypothetical protein H7210_02930, partial [Pyrinomonadaceae bacterium]|nr:hypothetical protein [Phycisphaerales bacterium]